jgi:hypothetical protein
MQLEDILTAAEATQLAGFVAELRRGISAVEATLNLPWTASPAEGQIGRIKMLKRTMYGRAASNSFAPASCMPRDGATAAREVRENQHSPSSYTLAPESDCHTGPDGWTLPCTAPGIRGMSVKIWT